MTNRLLKNSFHNSPQPRPDFATDVIPYPIRLAKSGKKWPAAIWQRQNRESPWPTAHLEDGREVPLVLTDT
jgi:hypothetical protein